MARTAVKTRVSRKAPKTKLGRVLQYANETVSAQIPNVDALMAELAETRKTIQDLSTRIGQTARHAHGSASAAFSSASEKVSEATSDMSDKASAAAQSAAESAEAIGTEIETFTRRNPIVALAAAVGLGLVIGIAARNRK